MEIVVCMGGTMMVGDGGDPWLDGALAGGPVAVHKVLTPPPGSGLCQLYAISRIVHRCDLLLFLALIS